MFSAKNTPEISQSEGSSRTLAARRDGLKVLGLAVLLNALLFSVFFALATPCYETDDDLGMQMIASGFYTGQPSEYLVFTSFLIGWPLRFFYSLWPGCNWYFAYLVAVHYAALTAIAFVVLSRWRRWPFGLLYVGFFLLVETHILLELQFTTTAFLAGTAGLLLLVDGLQSGRTRRWSLVIAGFAFSALMVMIREAVAPMLLLIALPFLIERFGLAGWRRLLGAGLACGALFVALQGMNRWYYDRDPAWAEFREFNSLRGQIHDHRLQLFIPQAAPAVGWSTNDARLFGNFYFPEPEVYASISRMRLFVDDLKRQAGAKPLSFPKAPSRFLFLPWVFGRDSGFLLKLALLNAAWCVYAARSQRRRCFNTLLVSYGLFVLMSLYLRLTAHLPERVSYNMPLFLHVICLYWASGFHTLPAAVPRPNVLNRLLPTFTRPGVLHWATRVLVFVCAVQYISFVYHLGEGVWYANAFNRRLKVMSRRIFEPVRTLLPPGHKPILVPLPYDTYLQQSVFFYPRREKVPFCLVPSFGWLPHSPLFRQILDEHQLRPFSLSLVDRRDVFFLMDRSLMDKYWLGWLQTFYREHYGLEIRFDMVLNTDEMPEYSKCRLYLYQAHAVHPTLGGRPIP
jgi:hypothetical protein